MKLAILFFAAILARAQFLPFPGSHSDNSGGGAGIVVVGSASATSASGSGSSLSVSLTMSQHSTALVGIGYFNQALTPTTVKLSDGTTSCVQDAGGRDDGTRDSLWVYRCTDIPSGITGVTVTHTGGAFAGVTVVEVTGLNASPLDATTVPKDTGNPWVTNVLSPTASQSELIFAVVYEENFNAITATSPYILGNSSLGSVVAIAPVTRIVLSTTGTYTPGGTVNSRCAAMAVSYKQ